MPVEYIAVGAFVGALSAYAVKGLVDLLFHRFGPEREEGPGDPHSALADAAYREIDRVRLRQRKSLYAEFDQKMQAAVDEMSQGWHRLSLIYAARDRFEALKRLGSEDVVRAARKMCNVCVDMMDNGYDEVSHNRFYRAQAEYYDACARDLAKPPSRRPPDQDPKDRSNRPRRKYITPHL